MKKKQVVYSNLQAQRLRRLDIGELHQSKANDADVLVSFTSIPSRFADVDLVVRSVLSQSVAPARLVLWLNDRHVDSLPPSLTAMLGPKFEIRYTPLDSCHCKLVPSLQAFPDQTIVLDHCGTPLGTACYAGKLDKNFERWRGSIRELAKCQNVVVKLGGLAMQFCGMPAEGPTDSVSSDELAQMWRPYVDTCIEAFGPDRAMFESNYPVDKWAGSYATLWNALKCLASGASDDEKRALFAGTAARVYRVENLLGLT